MCTNCFRALIAAWLGASQRSRDGVQLNMFASELLRMYLYGCTLTFCSPNRYLYRRRARDYMSEVLCNHVEHTQYTSELTVCQIRRLQRTRSLVLCGRRKSSGGSRVLSWICNQHFEQVGEGIIGLKAPAIQTLSQPSLLLLVCFSSGKLICFEALLMARLS